ncbi:MAG: hypothetical protein Q7S11_02520 [bacterium]|nr:hypothetical protein [bacterium]
MAQPKIAVRKETFVASPKVAAKSSNLLVDSWGYPMTFVEFYKILTRNKFTVQIIKIGSEILGDAQKFNGFSGKVVPNLSEEKIKEKFSADIRTDETGKEYFLLNIDDDTPHFLREWTGHAMRFNHLSND